MLELLALCMRRYIGLHPQGEALSSRGHGITYGKTPTKAQHTLLVNFIEVGNRRPHHLTLSILGP